MSEYSPADPNYKIDRRPPEPATKATELARLTREQGMGLLMGKFPKSNGTSSRRRRIYIY